MRGTDREGRYFGPEKCRVGGGGRVGCDLSTDTKNRENQQGNAAH